MVSIHELLKKNNFFNDIQLLWVLLKNQYEVIMLLKY